jgi:hypothetical protein
MSNKKQSSIDFIFTAFNLLSDADFKAWMLNNYDDIKAMHKEEVKMIIEHYHNNMFYFKLTEKELKNITEIMYDKTFGGQDNE